MTTPIEVHASQFLLVQTLISVGCKLGIPWAEGESVDDYKTRLLESGEALSIEPGEVWMAGDAHRDVVVQVFNEVP
jgi:hypothetical protein